MLRRARTLFCAAAALAAGCTLDRAGFAADAGVFPEDVPASDAPPPADAPGSDTFVPPVDGGPLGWTRDLAVVGAFSRASEGSYQMGGPSADVAFLAWAPANVRRLEDRGDGAGPLLLLEGEATNLVLDSRATGSAAWSLGGFAPMADAARGPDGEMRAERYVAPSGFSQGQATPIATNPHTLSAWGRAVDDPSVWTANYSYPTQPSGAAWFVADQPATWARRSSTVVPSMRGNYHPIDLTIGFGMLDLYLDLHQVEAGRFPTSVIRTTLAAGTRAADVLTLASSDIPDGALTRPAGFAEVSPVFGSADLVAGSEHWIVSIGGAQDGIRFRHTGSAVVIEVVSEGTVRASSAPLTFDRNALLGQLCWDPEARTVTVGGMPGLLGALWSWPEGMPMRIGGVLGASSEGFVRLGPFGSC